MATTDMITCATPGAVGRERTRFFPRQLVTPDDLTQDQTYFREKLRRHNRMLHGWGIVCGAAVRKGTGGCEVVVEPGYVLGPWGDEIYIDREVTVDVCREGNGGDGGPCAELDDPWCSDVRVERERAQRLYLAVRYTECQSRPVRVAVTSCGCGEGDCEYSRLRDSFEIKALDGLPSSYDVMTAPSIDSAASCQGGRHPCPACPEDPWVVLADLAFDETGKVATIDQTSHRRYTASFADFFYTCGVGIESLKLAPSRMAGVGKSRATVTLTGPAPFGGATVTLSSSDAGVPVPASLLIPAGAVSGGFDINVGTVTAKKSVTVVGSYAGESRTDTLTLLPLLKLKNARLRSYAANNPADPNAAQIGAALTKNTDGTWYVSNDGARPNALDLEFVGAQVDPNSVKGGTSILFGTAGSGGGGTIGVLSVTQVVSMGNNVLRLIGTFDKAEGAFTTKLVGNGSAAITSVDGVRLDGELLATLPSGDSVEGGDCIFSLSIFYIN